MLPPKEKQKLPPNFRALDITISFLVYFMHSNLGLQRNKFILVFDYWCPYSSIWKIFILFYLKNASFQRVLFLFTRSDSYLL